MEPPSLGLQVGYNDVCLENERTFLNCFVCLKEHVIDLPDSSGLRRRRFIHTRI